jgi:hypothetical protein
MPEGVMGFIDIDSHVWECADTWSHFDPKERIYGPPDDQHADWLVEGISKDVNFIMRDGMYQIYSDGTLDLTDVAARVRQMDELGVDVQICHSNLACRA